MSPESSTRFARAHPWKRRSVLLTSPSTLVCCLLLTMPYSRAHTALISRCVCQSLSPFAIIHANRAFFTYSGLSPQDVIGKPIDAIIQVKDVKDIINESKHASDPDFATGMLENKSCQVQFKPVASHCMSHLLVQIYSDDAAAFAKAAISAAKHANVLVGCVG